MGMLLFEVRLRTTPHLQTGLLIASRHQTVLPLTYRASGLVLWHFGDKVDVRCHGSFSGKQTFWSRGTLNEFLRLRAFCFNPHRNCPIFGGWCGLMQA
jgi:hypothetical protein